MKLTIIFLFAFSFISFAQYSEQYEEFRYDYSDNIVNYFSVGNLGFDTEINTYNPNIINSPSDLFIQTGAFSNISQTGLVNERNLFHAKLNVYPNFAVQYQDEWYSIQVSYINSMSTSFENNDLNWVLFYVASTNDLAFPTRNTIFRISSTIRYDNNINFSIGLLTNNFDMKLDLGDGGYVRYYRNFFDNVQFFIGVNYSYRDVLKAYLIFRNEKSPNELKIENGLKVNFLNAPYFGTPNIYFNGLLGLGFKYSVLNNLGISLESRSDFFDFEKQYPEDNRSKHVFNTEIVAGVNYRPVKEVNAGILFSKYVEYKNPLYSMGGSEKTHTAPFTIHFGASYQYRSFILSMFYQFSKVIFEDVGNNFYTTFTETSQYLGFGVGYEL
jgi:hypothetical protein